MSTKDKAIVIKSGEYYDARSGTHKAVWTTIGYIKEKKDKKGELFVSLKAEYLSSSFLHICNQEGAPNVLAHVFEEREDKRSDNIPF